MPYIYILECADGSYYTGSTWDLDRRLREHHNGEGSNHTRNGCQLRFSTMRSTLASTMPFIARNRSKAGPAVRKRRLFMEMRRN